MNDFINTWNSGKLDKPKLRSYNLFKDTYEVDNYVIKCDKYVRSYLAQIRSGILPVNIQVGRHRNLQVTQKNL